jgi:hypothetical protein
MTQVQSPMQAEPLKLDQTYYQAAEPAPSLNEWPQTYHYQENPFAPPKTDMIDRSIMIAIFVAFIAGLLLGKIMNPVILKH